jgi:NADH-quinone oxidoreductase subunit N
VSVVQGVDQAALAPVYVLAAAAVLVLVTDLVIGPRLVLVGLGGLGAAGAAVAGLLVGSGHRGTFCTGPAVLPSGTRVGASCSFVVDGLSLAVTVSGCALAVVVLALSTRVSVPLGEYVFLLLCSLLGLVVLGSARDLLTLLIAVETLTLPVYILVGLRRAEAAVTFFVTSVVSTALSLLGVGLLYGVVGALHLDRVATALQSLEDQQKPLVSAAVLLILGGLLLKLAAVPFHAWAPGTYDGAPLPVAAWLGTASKLGGAVAVLVTVEVARLSLEPVLLLVAVVTMTLGNLVALRQRRLVRLLAWSSVAQSGYLLVPIALHDVAATAGFVALYLVASVSTFAAVVALRGTDDGGTIDELRGASRRSPWATGALVLGLAGLAGLPPGLAGLFAKVVVVRAALDGSAGWLAVVIGLNAVLGLAYYVRVGAACFAPGEPVDPPKSVTVGTAVLVTSAAGVVLGAWPQWVLSAAEAVAGAFR